MASSMGGPFRGSRNWWPIQEFSCRRGRDHPWVKFVVALRTMSLRPLQGRRVFLGESRGSPAKAGSPLAEFCCRFATNFRGSPRVLRPSRTNPWLSIVLASRQAFEGVHRFANAVTLAENWCGFVTSFRGSPRVR